jgi:predicted esterase
MSKPTKNLKRVLILFGGFPEKPENIKREFTIQELALEKNIAVLYMNYNQKLWLEETEKQKLAELLQKIFAENKLPTNDTYVGGFSSGGMLLC